MQDRLELFSGTCHHRHYRQQLILMLMSLCQHVPICLIEIAMASEAKNASWL